MAGEIDFVNREFPAMHTLRGAAVRADADMQGFAAGYAAGMRAAREDVEHEREQVRVRAEHERAAQARQVADALAVLRAAVGAVERCAVPILEQAQRQLGDAAIELAEAILMREAPDPAAAVAIAVDRISSSVDAADVVVLRLHPDDLAALEAAGSVPQHLTVIADAARTPGDVIAELPDGYLDAGIRSALERARRALETEQA